MAARTLFQVLDHAATNAPQTPALHQPKGDGAYTVYTWQDWKLAAMEIALGLSSLGVKKGDVVALQSESRAEFYLADLGVMAMGAVSAALYTAYPAADQVKNLRNCGAQWIFAEDAKTMAALANALKNAADPPEMRFILLTGKVEGAMTLDALRGLGRNALQDDPGAFLRLGSQVTPDDPAVLYLTSGATGEPKMGLARHGSITMNLEMGPKVLPLGPKDRALVFLPSAHIAQRVVMEFLMIEMAVPVYFSESLAKMPNELRSLKPTFILAPPRVWERIYSSIRTEVNKKSALMQRIFHGALGLGLEAARYRQQHKPLPGWMELPLGWADKLVFSKLRERLGNSLRVAISGAAPLGRDTALFFDAIGMPITEGYGLTEGGVLSMNPVDRQKYGSIGVPLPGVEFKLAEDGELLAKSPTLFEGYFRDPAATATIIKDGWLHTGDIATIDDDGYVRITGRKKEVLVSSSGKKIYPARVESLFKSEPLVSQIFLVGDRLPYVSALFTVNPAAAETLPPGVTVQEQLKKAVKKANAELPEWEQVRKFKVLNRDFSIDHGELTPTMKVRRGKVLENFKEEISGLYAGKQESH
jgi:long-chain acyl-CoA synthetase